MSTRKKLKWQMITRYMCRARISRWQQLVLEKLCIKIHVGENVGRKVLDRALMDYVLLPKRMRERLSDVNVCSTESWHVDGRVL